MVGASQRIVSQPASLATRIIGAYSRPRGSFHEERTSGLDERRLIAIGFGATLFLPLGRVMAESVRPELAVGPDRTAWFAATILIGFSFGLLALYAIAALIRLVCRAIGGGGGWAETRLALFWSGLAAGPFIAFGHVLGALIEGRSLAALLGGVCWAVLFIPMLAAAQGFSTGKVALFFAILCTILLAIPNLG